MRKYVSTITQRGQVTLPAEVRRWLGVKPSDQVEFTINDDQVTVKPVTYTLKDVYGAVKPLSQPMDFDTAIRDAKEERAERAMRRLREQQ
jgi:AbrB family looped-hinge helix DNA binding protein